MQKYLPSLLQISHILLPCFFIPHFSMPFAMHRNGLPLSQTENKWRSRMDFKNNIKALFLKKKQCIHSMVYAHKIITCTFQYIHTM